MDESLGAKNATANQVDIGMVVPVPRETADPGPEELTADSLCDQR
jgi:hypothetical protein